MDTIRMIVLEPAELIRRPTAQDEAGRQYAHAVERHFDDANRLVRQGKPDEAEEIAWAAADLRRRARIELR